MISPAYAHLIEQLTRLPGIGEKTAQRLAFYLLKMPATEARQIGQAIVDAAEKIALCTDCNNISETGLCAICEDGGRDRTKILVVEESSVLHTIERTGEFKGLYHVLLGARAPLSESISVDPAITRLIHRLQTGHVTEVILATSPNMNGEAVAFYLTQLIKPLDIQITRIACGIPAGVGIEYVDEVTLAKSLEGRYRI